MVASMSLNASVELARAIASMHTILRTGPVIASGLDDQRYALGDWRSHDAPGRGRGRCVARRPHFRHIMRPADLAPIWSRMPRWRCCAVPAPRRSSPTCGVTSSGRRMVARPPSHSRRAAPVGNWLRSTAVAPQSSRRPRLTATSRVSCGRASSGPTGPSGARAWRARTPPCASTSYVVQEAGGLVAGPGEDCFVGKQRHGRAP
jgi:hypothetical protein